MVAALDRCRSYRSDPATDCTLIALDNELVRPGMAIDDEGHVILRMTFLEGGFMGSREAALDHAPGVDRGHIWLVDVAGGRDCKGEWQEKDGSTGWWMLCQDGARAVGDMTPPREGTGRGMGVTSVGEVVEFTFAPDDTTP